MNAADDHRRIAGIFTARVLGTPAAAWDTPAPPEGWVARDVVRHLVEWFPSFLEDGAGVKLAGGPSVDDDPAAAGRCTPTPCSRCSMTRLPRERL